MKQAYICSPYRGNVERNKQYARHLTERAIMLDFAPICPHLYITEVLNDDIESERAEGLEVALALLKNCDVVFVGDRYGISEGMSAEIALAKKMRKIILFAGVSNKNSLNFLKAEDNGLPWVESL